MSVDMRKSYLTALVLIALIALALVSCIGGANKQEPTPTALAYPESNANFCTRSEDANSHAQA